MGIRSSPQATKEKLGGKRQNGSLQQLLQESSQVAYGAQCNNLGSLQAAKWVQCEVIALVFTNKVRRQMIVIVCLYIIVR